ncbi:NADP-dependent oxidoreductase [uncultured Agrococcus sp.]|uniref:NADP-dependent oxidoreductase n=1 Tax=uncultured Agrococcus sp. TaxID=382258 RepID=UPI0025DCB911|nr:NADP-dependent oxidoreductase [uncultured Agrococcus sp.]
MRAVALQSLGPDAVPSVTDVEAPIALMNEALVDVRAAGINPIDWKSIRGKGVAPAVKLFPWVPGNDFAGTVAQSPYEAHELQAGDAVFGIANPGRSGGSFAEQAAVSTLQIARKPESLTFEEAAAVPCAGLTAWDAVVRVAKARTGQRILVHAGAGGVGHFAVQFARFFGAHVIATASERNLDFLRELGADEVIDYRAQRFEETTQKVDVVVDLVGNVQDDTGSRSLNVLKSDGLYLNIPTGSWPGYAEAAERAGMRYSHIKVEPDRENLATIGRLLDNGDVRVHVDDVFALEDIESAIEAQSSGHTRGKLVLKVA